MNALTEIVAAPPAGTDLVVYAEQHPALMITSKETYDAFYAAIKAEVDAFVPDVTTDKGRKAIASLAAKVSKTKVMIDDAGKLLKEEAQALVKTVDAARKPIRDQLDQLRDLARKPLTDWEAAEERRAEHVRVALERLQVMGIILVGDTSAEIGQRLEAVRAFELREEMFLELHPIAVERRAAAIANLESGLAALRQAEADRAELLRLQAAEAERVRLEAEAQAERDRAAAAQREEQQRQLAAQRIAQEAAATAERRTREAADKLAAEAAAQVAATHAAQLAEAERKRRKVADELAAANRRAAQAESDRKAAEAAAAARAADRAHRGVVMGAAKEALMTHAGLDEETAKRVVLAITGGHVPAVTMEF